MAHIELTPSDTVQINGMSYEFGELSFYLDRREKASGYAEIDGALVPVAHIRRLLKREEGEAKATELIQQLANLYEICG